MRNQRTFLGCRFPVSDDCFTNWNTGGVAAAITFFFPYLADGVPDQLKGYDKSASD